MLHVSRNTNQRLLPLNGATQKQVSLGLHLRVTEGKTKNWVSQLAGQLQ